MNVAVRVRLRGLIAVSLLVTAGCSAPRAGTTAVHPPITSADAPATAATPPAPLTKIGRVEFSMSCRGHEAEFERAMAFLHSFFYRRSMHIFRELAAKEPSCAIAHWGVAMSLYHPLWYPPTAEELEQGRAAIAKAQAAAMKSPYEKSLIDALAVFYTVPETRGSPGGMNCHGPTEGHSARAIAYADAMEKVYAAYPGDVEVSAFYALSLLGSASPVDPTLANQRKAAAILETLWATRRDHPGVAHYLIHAYDSPELATKGLEAARLYASIAPAVPHALHMPSHIFVRLGMWDEATDSNTVSVATAQQLAREERLDGAPPDELHALDYLTYSYLQTGQDAKARQIVEYVATLKRTSPASDFSAAYAIGSIPARYAVERHAWTEAAALQVPKMTFWTTYPVNEAHLEYARALGRARTGDLVGARKSLARLGELREASTDPKFEYFKKHLALHQKAVTAWIRRAEGKNEEALALLRQAAEAEEKLGKPSVSPNPINLIYEQLGDMLLELGKPDDAIVAYTAGLRSSPRRLNSVLGIALASEEAGKLDVARQHFEQAVAMTPHSDLARPDLAHARSFLAKSPR